MTGSGLHRRILALLRPKASVASVGCSGVPVSFRYRTMLARDELRICDR